MVTLEQESVDNYSYSGFYMCDQQIKTQYFSEVLTGLSRGRGIQRIHSCSMSLVLFVQHFVQPSVPFLAICIRQVHCSYRIIRFYYYFGTENINTDQTNCKKNSKRQRPGEVTKVYTEEPSAYGQVHRWKGSVCPLKTIHNDSRSTILVQGQETGETIQRRIKLQPAPGWAATAEQRRQVSW